MRCGVSWFWSQKILKVLILRSSFGSDLGSYTLFCSVSHIWYNFAIWEGWDATQSQRRYPFTFYHQNLISSSLSPRRHLWQIWGNSLEVFLRHLFTKMEWTEGRSTWKHNASSCGYHRHGCIKIHDTEHSLLSWRNNSNCSTQSHHDINRHVFAFL